MLGHDFYYNENIRTLVATFGKLFSDVYIRKANSTGYDDIKVPLHFGSKEKIYQYVFENESDNISLPRMGFDFNVTGPDPMRKSSRLNTHILSTGSDSADWFYNAVPYDFNFDLTIFANDIEDSLQMVEQILPLFQPSLTVKIKPFKDYPDIVVDITIILESVQNNYETSGSINDKDYYSWDLSFAVKGWMFSKVNTAEPIILDITNVSLYNMETGEKDNWSPSS